jgi:hypothetical protein
VFEHPYFLSIFLLAAAFLLFRKRKYFLKHASVSNLSKTKKYNSVMVLNCFGWTALVIAASGLTWGEILPVSKKLAHKYVLVNDASGSMIEGEADGRGPKLIAVERGNSALLKMLSKREDGSIDKVGAMVFSNDAYIVSYIVDDPEFVQQKLNSVNYRLPPLGGGTNVDKALWSSIGLFLKDAKQLSEEQLFAIGNLMYGTGGFEPTETAQQIIERFKPFTVGCSVVIFTDGMFFPDGNESMMSTYKLLQLSKRLGIRVYLISVETIDRLVFEALLETGGTGIVLKGFDVEALEKVYADIVKSQSHEEFVTEESIKRSLSFWFGSFALTCLGVANLLRYTVNRSFTEV